MQIRGAYMQSRLRCQQLEIHNDIYMTELCLLYTSDAADDSLRVDLGGRRII